MFPTDLRNQTDDLLVITCPSTFLLTCLIFYRQFGFQPYRPLYIIIGLEVAQCKQKKRGFFFSLTFLDVVHENLELTNQIKDDGLRGRQRMLLGRTHTECDEHQPPPPKANKSEKEKVVAMTVQHTQTTQYTHTLFPL